MNISRFVRERARICGLAGISGLMVVDGAARWRLAGAESDTRRRRDPGSLFMADWWLPERQGRVACLEFRRYGPSSATSRQSLETRHRHAAVHGRMTPWQPLPIR